MIPSDADLVHAVQRGDRDAFGILVDRHRARAIGLAAAMLGDFGEAEDVAQEALYQAYFGIDRLRDPARFGAWLCGIAVNLAKMALRRRRTTFSLDDLDGGRVAHGFRPEDATPEAEFEARELRETVRSAIGRLPEDLRAAVWMHYVEGSSYREIGALFGVAPGTLRVQTHRARRKLREALIGEWGEPAQREEVAMIEVDVQDVLLWMPKSASSPCRNVGRIADATPAKRHVVLLKERRSDRALPIWIGPHEAAMLALHLAEVYAIRPLTFDFMARLLDAVDVSIDRVAIHALKDTTFLATVSVRSGEVVRDLDARPSDAINLAARASAPIFVDEAVMQQESIAAEAARDELTRKCAEDEELPDEDYEWRSGREVYSAKKPND